MIPPDDVQAALLTVLRANGPLIGALPEGANGIRENQWKGTAFQYPNVRISRITSNPEGNGNCSSRRSRIQFTIGVFSKSDSTLKAQTLQGLVIDALDGVQLKTGTFRTISIRPQLQTPVSPAGGDESEVWSGSVTFRTIGNEI